MDDLDRITAQDEQLMELRIKGAHQNAAERELQPIGRCHWCLDGVDGDKVFCDEDCASDYQRHERG